MKRTRVRGQKEPAHTSSTIVPAPTPLQKGKRKHTNSVTEEPKRMSNEGRVQQPLQPLRQHDSKKAKLTPKLSKAYRAPNLLQRDKDLLGNYKRVQDDAAESDLDLDEDGEDRDGRDSLLDDNDRDEELADLTVDNLDDEGVQWANKSAKNHYVTGPSKVGPWVGGSGWAHSAEITDTGGWAEACMLEGENGPGGFAKILTDGPSLHLVGMLGNKGNGWAQNVRSGGRAMPEDRPSGLHVILKITTDGPTVDFISEKANWASAYADAVSETVTDGPSPLCLNSEKATDGPSPPWIE
ncbi:uncharacterized protein F5891DRAFT_991325 [Suillus fuscotomentosus]|uniref:Uncharacterized protein n=1 Tax=Suillus fuscotomentosus TaxID=1912939 RepID=A0AAD4HBZ9_9AGAM|nr:uncharacterized protein F5891DRAFT_991325 [Suillus fuscotomentosus]KAG1882298.1 hypothetical protein F5891DRAFT_991325 [Suillus fuscotomentosus]